MNLVSTPVVAASALVTSPLLWKGLVAGTMPMETTVTRFLMVMVGVWLAMSVVEMMIGDPATPTRDPGPAEATRVDLDPLNGNGPQA